MGEHVLGRALGRLGQGPGQELLGHAELQAVERRQEAALAHVDDRSDLVWSSLAEELGQDLEHLKALRGGLKPFEDCDEILEAHQWRARAPLVQWTVGGLLGMVRWIGGRCCSLRFTTGRV